MKDFLTTLGSGDLNIATEFTWIFIATALSMIGGAIGGMLLAGKDIGYEFSATLGALFGPAGIIPALILSFALLNLFTNH
ncbi:hypothetical protein [Umezakia ovalisporum]|jgi:hypothetical protein|uniref:Uncharacterized protein n=2 Tax=Umezakia ovalisporum TaxID=75695 RepID=A0AA43KF14_9CYAN|nr:hypothetical protein [Umezakia ovalisporum]MBI1241570.1 hypothetical protein [Nostoc sp. RI_552]MDH6057640.1 hypothetical protein [Umezakia ovalisporum FSS-43]MDH6063523.1 hypothetical protein [Umezakia ovalisporum FSS-62]MDH6066030.1 hypothetical protein [Umezakia ovalisporum APH033B]MDH6072448.1 hypothetical protein [Umezakia ovalisporum CobakiLakeA]